MRDSLCHNTSEFSRPKRFGRAAVLFLAFACLALAPATLLAATLTATLDRATVAVGESATLTLVFEGGSPKTPPALPRLQNLRTTVGSQSSQFSWVNGKSTSSVTYTYSLTPVQPGDFTIPPITAEVDGKTLSSPPITLKAARAAAAQPDAAGADNQIALLKLVLPKKQVYLGEIIPIELQLFVRDGVQNIQQFQASPFNADGFAFGKTVQGAQRQARIGNANFSVVPFQATITAVKTGTLKIEPVDFSMVVLLPATGQQQPTAFDPFGMFQRGEQRRITLSTEAETVEVLPLPEGAPAGYSGAVGNYSMTMTAAPTDVTAGDPITIKAQITGRGALDAVTLPVQTAWQDFKTYPPSSKVQPTDQIGLQGTKYFELVVVPQTAELKQLPPFTFSFFDPEQKTYRTLTQPAVAIKVRPGAASASPTLASGKQENPPPAQDIVPIKLRAGRSSSAGGPLVTRPLFWAVQGLPVLAWAALLVRRRRAESLANNPRLRRQRQVAQFVRQGLAGLNSHAQENNSAAFFALVFRLLQEQLGERLDLPAASITEAVIEERLQRRRLPAPMLTRLHELFQACNLARYAPMKSSQELEAFIPRIEAALREIQEIKS